MTISEFNGQYKFLSNFSLDPVLYEERWYDTSEHAFQAAKAASNAEKLYVAMAQGPGHAKSRGRRVSLRPDWEEVKDQIMLDILRSKFSQDPLKQQLLATGEEELIEGNEHNDTYWGVYNGLGQNMLGKILMQVRFELRQKDSQRGP